MQMIFYKNRRSFTLIELITVVIIIGVIAAFAIPSYQTAVERAYERSAVANLRSIADAEKIYFNEYKTYWPNPLDSTAYWVADINTTLHLNIIEMSNYPRMQFLCTTWGGVNCIACYPSCYPPWPADHWTLVVDAQHNDWAPYCYTSGGPPCPSCKSWDQGGCPY